MKITIIVNKKMEDFEHIRFVDVEVGESNDGMRRGGGSYTIEGGKSNFFFENEKEVEGGYQYDLRVEGEYEEKFPSIVTVLSNKGVKIIEPCVYCEVSIKRNFYKGYVELDFNLFDMKEVLETALPIYSSIDEYVEREKVFHQFSHVIRDWNYEFQIAFPFSSVWEMRGTHETREIPDSQDFSSSDIEQSLKKIVQNLKRVEEKEKDYIHPAKTVDKVSDFIDIVMKSLSEEEIKLLLSYADTTEQIKDLQIQYAPEWVHWNRVALNKNDLDIILEKGACYVLTSNTLISVMEDAETERKVFSNIIKLMGRHTEGREFQEVIDGVNHLTSIEILRATLSGMENDFYVNKKLLDVMSELTYTSANVDDYNMLKTVVKSNDYRGIELLVELGCIAQVDEDIVANDILESGTYKTDYILERIYKEYSFAPGLAWIAEKEQRVAEQERLEEARREAERKEKEKEKEAVDSFMKNKIAYGPLTFEREGYKAVIFYEGKRLGVVDTDKYMFIEGSYTKGYVLNLEKIKTIKNGVLHMDVDKDHAGYIIGRGGKRIKEITEQLNEKGCYVKRINLHS